ncbi:hypothetical protein QBC42DRAFT_186588 [Cladorrhinum samala]|uniref:Uncharacterized protein n=1 Tax=Cladorrhinum samala TaxID=585594 RepID=A0AAV9HBL7_9PEZI|nr:hypothetical protein QBC42DRAFT_186588 [Cladorrhinum samala]
MGDVDRAVDHDAPALGPKTGLTPLAAAVVSGNADEVQQLLEKGADPNERSLNGETPLLLAAWKAAREAPLITQLLLSKLSRDSVDDTCDAAENKTPLMCAIERAAASKSSLDLEVIRLLRSAGASLAIRNNDGFNATEVAKGLKVGATSIVRMKAIFRALHPESERSSLATLNSVVVSFLLFVVGAVNNLSDGAVDRLSGGKPTIALRSRSPTDGKSQQVNKTTEVQTAQQFIKNVDDYVKRNPVFATFFGKDNEDFIQELARKLVDLAKDSTSALGQPGVLPNTTQLTLYQQVIYYDDNSSTQKTKWWKHQEKLALGIAQITTRLLPDGEGVALRATNQGPSTDNYYILNLEALGEAMDSMRWKSYGSLDMGTNMKSYGSLDMGTNMKSGILQPLVYDKLAAGTLKRPLLVSIVTDGDCGPEGKDDSLANAILECGNRLVEAKYPRDSKYLLITNQTGVKFVIGQVGSGRRATQFLESLRSNDKIAEVAYIVSEKVDEKFAEFNDNYWSLDRWVSKTRPIFILFYNIRTSRKKVDYLYP